jgi:hypothetical protein
MEIDYSKIFHLYKNDNPNSPRQYIIALYGISVFQIPDEFALNDQTEANSWLEAKQKFGFILTSYQEYLLEQKTSVH